MRPKQKEKSDSDGSGSETVGNIGAMKNNPFEYWLTLEENPEYLEIMTKVEDFIETPGDFDVHVDIIFSQEMYDKLEGRMKEVEWSSVRNFWNNDLHYENLNAA